MASISSSGFESSVIIEAKSQIESVEADEPIMFQPRPEPLPESSTEPTKFYESENPGSDNIEQTAQNC